jgi:hypothetical protein
MIGLENRPVRRTLNHQRRPDAPLLADARKQSAMFLPQLRGLFWCTRSPFRADPQREASEVLDEHSSTNTKRSESMALITIIRKAALRNSSCSLAPSVLFSVEAHPPKCPREGHSLSETPATCSEYSCLCLSLAKGGSSCASPSRSLLAFLSSLGFLPGAFPSVKGSALRKRPSHSA